MHSLDLFYSPLPSLLISAALLVVVCLLSWRGKGRKIALGLSILLFARYIVWRGVYTLNLEDSLTTSISLVLLVAEIYGFIQFLLFSYQAWAPTDRQSPAIDTYPSVDIMVTVVDEPLYILKRTLIGCMAQDYPDDRFNVYVLDDGQREETKALAAELGVSYLSRADLVNAKAGNLNAAMQRTSGDLIVVFDVDHVPFPSFLKKTVGFFVDEEVAVVQTAQDFYNEDIFQRSVAPGRHVFNEQALFFRILQAGRDRHNSAFFAGSSGVLRRSALEGIGGFQTETITEDIHTSLLLHSKGYKSVYLNETLASGLMPETFEAHTRQRARWATGTAQVFIRENPLFKRGLTWAQRIDYFGSIHYFFFGLPRIVFLIAPLSWLLFSIPALKSDTIALINFFFSAYISSLLAIQMISRNTRNAFWSDVHETVMCFAVTAAAFVGVFSANKRRPFQVTPKGTRSETRTYASISAVGWHVAVFGLLIFGITSGVMQWNGPNPAPGLAISLWWACFNLVLITAAILPAREQPQLRDFVRRTGRFPCLILDDSNQTDAEILDVSESGAAIRIPAPWYSLQKHIRVAFRLEEDEVLTVEGTIVRQELEETGEATIGVQFEELDEPDAQALIRTSFSTPHTNLEDASVGASVFGSLRSLISVLSRFREQLRLSRRRTPRLPQAKACRLELEGTVLQGRIRDVSFSGVSAVFPGSYEVRSQASVLTIEDVALTVSPIESFGRGGETIVRFRVESILKGAPTWQAWHQPS